MSTLERRLAGIEAELAELAPRPSKLDEFKAANPWFEWTRDSEVEELAEIYRQAEEGDGMPEVDEARVMAIIYASKARMFAREPTTNDLLAATYKRALEVKGR